MSEFNPYQINVETVVAASPMLGHRLENRSKIRQAQDLDLLESWQDESSIPLRHSSQQNAFVVAPLDILVSRKDDRTEFHIIELNGTGIGGVSNLPDHVVSSVANSLRKVARSVWQKEAILLLPISGKENESDPRLNKLIHEKLIFAEAMSAGLRDAGGDSDLVTACGLQSGMQTLRDGVATVVMGYMKELLDACQLDQNGAVTMHGRPVVGAVNDRFCLNLISHFKGQVNLNLFTPINGTYLAGGDKGAVYSLLDDYLAHVPSENFPSRVNYNHATNRIELIDTVLDWLDKGRRPVIKPHGTGIGHGIEFFLDAEESIQSIIDRIDESIRVTEEYYKAEGGAFPYTVCEFIDTAVIDAADHRLDNHKYELRVVVYRDGLSLKACPTIAKVAVERFDADDMGRHNLINNITNASATKKVDGSDFMFPLCNRQTLDLLGISDAEMRELCRVATEFVRHAIDEIPQMDHRMEQSLNFKTVELPPSVLRRMNGIQISSLNPNSQT